MSEQPWPADPVAAVVHPDPYPYYARLRREKPFHFDEALGVWVAASAGAVREVLQHYQMRVRPPAEPVPRALVGTAAGEVFALLVRMNDGDFHVLHKPRVRASTARWTQEDVEGAAGEAASLLAARCDANQLLMALPAHAIARVLGVNATAIGRTVDAVLDFVQGIAGGATADAVARASSAAQELMAQGEGLGLPRVAAANRIALMQQSVDATAGLIGSCARTALAEGATLPASPAQWRALVEHTLLHDPPVHNTRRFAAAPVRLRGHDIGEGQGVLLLLASAVREEDASELAFGAAAHECPGPDIATEIAVAGLHALQQGGHLQRLFSRPAGFKPLPNARVPLFD